MNIVRWSAFAALALGVVAVTALAAACDGGGSGTPAVTPGGSTTPTATGTSALEELVQALVLAQEDVPAGLQEVGGTLSTNDDIAQASNDPEAELARLESLGREIGFDLTYVPGADTPPDLQVRGINTTASIYRTADGASTSFAEALKTLREQDWSVSYPALANLQAVEMDQPDLADEVYWVRVSGVETQDGDSALLVDDYVILRQARVRGLLRVVSLFDAQADRDSIFLDEVAEMARAQVQKIEASL